MAKYSHNEQTVIDEIRKEFIKFEANGDPINRERALAKSSVLGRFCCKWKLAEHHAVWDEAREAAKPYPLVDIHARTAPIMEGKWKNRNWGYDVVASKARVPATWKRVGRTGPTFETEVYEDQEAGVYRYVSKWEPEDTSEPEPQVAEGAYTLSGEWQTF